MSETRKNQKFDKKVPLGTKKIKILPAKRKNRLEMKEINEKCLPENYDISLWELFISYHNSFVLYADSVVIGYCLCGNDGSIASFAILSDYRGRGYGKKLLGVALDHLRKKFDRVFLQVRVSNNTAISLYKSVGFIINKTLFMYYGDGEDGYEMVVTK